jgi:hypothetical protein
MTKFVEIETQEEDVLFAAFGKLKPGQDPKRSILVKEGESIEGEVTEIKTSGQYTKIFVLKVKKQDKPVIIPGKMDLNRKMSAGKVKEGETVRITLVSKVKTQNNRDFYNFKVEVAR